MKPKSHALFIAAVFSFGLFTGLLLRDFLATPIHLGASTIEAPIAFKEADFPLPTVGQITDREGYTVCYDARSKNPYYVVEVLTAESLRGSADRSAQLFREDEAIPRHLRATLADYRGSGLDRGHMAPAANHKKSVQRMAESFFLNNVCPQDTGLNRGYWLAFEKQVRDLTKHYKTVQVISGPLYLPQGEPGERFVYYRCIGPNDIAVPSAFFKVLLLEHESGAVKERSYILPNTSIALETPLEAFQVTLQKVEHVSGIHF